MTSLFRLCGVAILSGVLAAGCAARGPHVTPVQPAVQSASLSADLFAPQPYGDFAVALLALDGSAVVAALDGLRTIPVSKLLEQGLGPGEIVTTIDCEMPAPGSWFYTKAMRRRLNSAAIVTVP